MAHRDAKTVKSAGRVLAILEYFDDIMRPAGAVEVRAQLGLPASSASALLSSLVGLGYLNYDARRRLYCPTLRVGLLGDWVQKGGAIRSLLEYLNHETGQLVVLGARCQLNAQYIHVVRADDSRPIRAPSAALLVKPIELLVVQPDAMPGQQQPETAVAEPPALRRQLLQLDPQRAVIRPV